ncbi:GNAT family N-acetyltransferase [Thalassomonas viridans]|uniref:GNAT family N-acetyltransferase n=1 Tax=Thalassomonas viridans TaxID=137584 RepID=A0AAE9Z642_9GAMM|nr:GNAT family N-acetyltransferase [Thalassomonas viridans]WDE05948.1 GNAT family N-acetyltransferase [Thalassomonas viridans]
MAVSIAQAGLQDVAPIAELFNLYRVFYQQQSNPELARQFIEQRLSNKESVIFYARGGKGQYLGFTQLYPNFSSVSAQRTWVLNDLYVLEQARGAGVGTLLLNRAKEHAVATGAKGIALETAESNIQAQKLYESLGYQKSSGFFGYFLTLNESRQA